MSRHPAPPAAEDDTDRADDIDATDTDSTDTASTGNERESLPDAQPDHQSDPQPEPGALASTLPAFAPVPRKKEHIRGWTAQRQRAFIEELASSGSVRSAARAVGLSPKSAYDLRRAEGAQGFRQAWEAALDLGIRMIEDVAMDRALNGVEEPVFAYGRFVGTRRAYNDQLLMFMLRNRAPKRFTGGQSLGLSASDARSLARLKKEWRKEWERELGALQMQREAETIASINAKIDAMRDREEQAARLEEKYRSAPPRPGDGTSAEELAAWTEAMKPSPQMQKLLPGYVEESEDTEEEPKVRRITDERW